MIEERLRNSSLIGFAVRSLDKQGTKLGCFTSVHIGSKHLDVAGGQPGENAVELLLKCEPTLALVDNVFGDEVYLEWIIGFLKNKYAEPISTGKYSRKKTLLAVGKISIKRIMNRSIQQSI